MSTCNVTGKITRLDQSPLIGQHVLGTVRSTLDDQGGQVSICGGVSSETIEAFTDINGAFCITLLQGAVVLLEIPAINLRKEILVPALGTIDFLQLI
jgi:hypothetical protein